MTTRTFNARRSQWAIAALFIVLGFDYGTWTSRLPALKIRLALNTAEVGFLLLAAALGAVFSFPVTATLMRKLGSRRTSILSGLLLPVVLMMLAVAPNFSFAFTVMLCEGVLLSCLNVSMNAQGVEVEIAGKQAIMSRLHAAFSLGGMAAALFAFAFSSLTDSLSWHFGVVTLLLWGGMAYALPGLIDDAASPDGEVTKHFMLPKGVALWLGLLAMCGMIVEGGMYDWSALYMKEVANASLQVAPLGIASIECTMLVSRWFGDRWRTNWGAARLLFWGGLLAGGGLACGLLLGGVIPALTSFALVGLGVAAISPCVYAKAAEDGAVALATVTTMGSVGALAGPVLISSVAQATNLSLGMVVIVIAAFSLSALTRRIQWA